MNEPRILVPFDAREALSLSQAAKVANRSPETIKRWAAEYEIGRPVVNRWHVSRYALRMLLDGDMEALRLFLSGDRASPRVVAYLKGSPQ